MVIGKMVTSSVVTVVPSYNPEFRLFGEVIKSVLKETSSVIVVDNGSENIEELKKLAHDATFISLNGNTGQAHALNVGVKEALKSSPEWILILDQDTIIEEGAITSLGNLQTQNPKIGIICMRKDISPGVFIEQRKGILSGNLVRAGIFRSLLFREAFFIDQIEFDFWYKVKKAGYEILGFGGGIRQHEAGKPIRIGKDVIYFEPHERFYYMVRNSTVLLRENVLTLRDWEMQIRHWYMVLVKVEGFRVTFRSLFYGLADGLFGRLGQSQHV